jgi:hypothetical protein
MMKKVTICLSAIALCLMSMPAIGSLNLASVPSHVSNPFNQQLLNQNFVVVYGAGLGTTKAKVTSNVYMADAGGYIYTYQISAATTTFTWFAAALNSIAVTNWGVDASGTQTKPAAWDPVDVASASTSIEAFFTPGLTAANSSAILWFTCAQAPDPQNGSGALAKLTVGNGVYAVGNVLVPIPEPLTMLLLGGGWMMMRTCNRKK